MLCKTFAVYASPDLLLAMGISGDVVYGTLLLLHRLYIDREIREQFYRIMLVRNDISISAMRLCASAPLVVKYALEDHAKNFVIPRLITYTDIEITIAKHLNECVEERIGDVIDVLNDDLHCLESSKIDVISIFNDSYDLAIANRDVNEELECFLIEHGFLSVIDINIYMSQD